MKEVGLIFQDWGIKEILDFRKTQTRRLHGLHRINENPDVWMPLGPLDSKVSGWQGEIVLQDQSTGEIATLRPRLQVGDIMYAKETWSDFCPLWDGAWCGCGSKEMIAKTHKIAYRATNTGIDHKDERGIMPNKWKSAMFMPKWAARIRRGIIRVRVEKVQNISEEDAIAEGLKDHMDEFQPGCSYLVTAKEKYQDAWNHINGADSWQMNPWVFVYEWNMYEVKK